MEEFDFIKSITPKDRKQSSVIKGIGDDAAILRYTDEDMIATVDTMVESVHFSEQTTEPFHIGYRALAANISDIAAMGGLPTTYLVSIVIPKGWREESLQEIYRGMDQLANAFDMDLVGGDTVSGKQLTISITVFGTVSRNNARYRHSAKEGDIVFVTGTLGDAACGLHVLLKESESLFKKYETVIKRHQMPYPRVEFINACQSINRIALNDVSDGIANEANEMAEASNQTILLEYDKIPSREELSNFSEDMQRKWKLSGGEDFELIGTVSEENWPALKKAAKHTNTMLTAIGKVIDNSHQNGTVLLQEGKQQKILQKSGYTHLRR